MAIQFEQVSRIIKAFFPGSSHVLCDRAASEVMAKIKEEGPAVEKPIGLTDADQITLRHSLGLDHASRSYRNYYVVPDADIHLSRLVELGVMMRGPMINENGGHPMRVFHVTDRGLAQVRLMTGETLEPLDKGFGFTETLR